MKFTNCKIYTPDFVFAEGTFEVENGVFKKCSSTDGAVDLEGAYVLPGLIDIHTHGNSGIDFTDCKEGGLLKMASYYAQNGVTSFCPTSLTLPEEVLAKSYKMAREFKEENHQGTASIEGINMEGPFFSSKKKGAQNEEYIKNPDVEMFKRLQDISGNLIKLADVAPELPGSESYIKEVCKTAKVSIAHSSCNYDEAVSAFDWGASHMTHLFNAMEGIHHRKPGPIIAAFENKNVTVEVIGDGLHLHPAIIRFIFFALSDERICLISDSLSVAGMKNGEYSLGGQEITLDGGIARLKSDGTIAGSANNLYTIMKLCMEFGVPKEKAVKAATFNPARVLGIENRVGMIKEGMEADFIISDSSFNIKDVFVKGVKVKREI